MRYISTAEAAELYGVSEQAIRKWCRNGELRCVRVDNLWRVEIDEKRKAAEVLADERPSHEVLVTSTLGGNFTWKN